MNFAERRRASRRLVIGSCMVSLAVVLALFAGTTHYAAAEAASATPPSRSASRTSTPTMTATQAATATSEPASPPTVELAPATPTMTSAPKITATPIALPLDEATLTPSPTPTPEFIPSMTATPTPTMMPGTSPTIVTIEPTPSVAPSATPEAPGASILGTSIPPSTGTPLASETAAPTITMTGTPTATPAVTGTPADELAPTETPTEAPTVTPTPEPVSIMAISPATITNDAPAALTVTGSGFAEGMQLPIGGAARRDVRVQSSTRLTATLPDGLCPGAYAVTADADESEIVTGVRLIIEGVRNLVTLSQPETPAVILNGSDQPISIPLSTIEITDTTCSTDDWQIAYTITQPTADGSARTPGASAAARAERSLALRSLVLTDDNGHAVARTPLMLTNGRSGATLRVPRQGRTTILLQPVVEARVPANAYAGQFSINASFLLEDALPRSGKQPGPGR